MVLEIILILLVLILGYTSWVQMIKVESYDELVEEQQTWIDEFINRVDVMSNTLKEIDSKGTYESDDEVGVFFKSLQQLQDRIETFIGETTDGGQKEKKEK